VAILSQILKVMRQTGGDHYSEVWNWWRGVT